VSPESTFRQTKFFPVGHAIGFENLLAASITWLVFIFVCAIADYCF
jgi:hypothetical protein